VRITTTAQYTLRPKKPDRRWRVAFATSFLITAETVAVDVRRGAIGGGTAAGLAFVLRPVQHPRAVLAAHLPACFCHFVVALREEVE